MLLGSQTPRLSLIPVGDDERGNAAVEFARMCGLTLYPWQEWLLREMCKVETVELEGEAVRRWAAREVVCSVARQNGKGEVLVARELAGIYRFGEKTILHTAHLMDTAIDAQKRLWEVIESNDDLLYWWEDDPKHSGTPHFHSSNGKESISFPNGAQVVFRTRSPKTGRGLSVDLLVFDECFHLPNEIYSAISKTVRAKTFAQTVFISTPVNSAEHMHGTVFSAKRWAALDGAKRTLFAEWSPADDDDPFSPETWAKANPSLVTSGAGAQLDDIEIEADAAKSSAVLLRTFLVETLGKGVWYPRDTDVQSCSTLIDLSRWQHLQDDLPDIPNKIGTAVFGIDIAVGGQYGSLVAAFQTAKGAHLTISPLTAFSSDTFVEELTRMVEKFDPIAVIMDPGSPAEPYVHLLDGAGVEPVLLSGAKVSSAFELLLRSIEERRVTHDGDVRFVEQWRNATMRGESSKYRSFNRFGEFPVTALNAAAFALWGLREFDELPAVDVTLKTNYSAPAPAVDPIADFVEAMEMNF